MRFTLKDYQIEAVTKILDYLQRAREDVHRRGDRVAFALSATTGAGKTVMATAVFEALFGGSDDFEFEADPTAAVLWVTDDPSLNEQTRARILESGDRLDPSQLRVIGEGGFDQEKFEPGNIYFLNIQKLGSATTWIKHSDRRTYTLWETIQNTIGDDHLTLYLVLDEAHRGMRSSRSKSDDENARSTIVQRLINGHNGIPPVPIVWGISATVQRFTDAMTAAHAEGRTTYSAVRVDPRTVQESGLLKDTIILDFPDEKGALETTLLRSAIREMREASVLWSVYVAQEGMPNPVLPLMVLQVPNKPSTAALARWLDVIYEEWPGLAEDAVANVFGEHATLALGHHTVPYIPPQDVQDASHIRILLAKDAVSTGWDCPRGEVMFSLRPAQDRTHITQLLGRMVRTPLARRVESDERLNAVTCVLPLFDKATATDVARVLTGEKEDKDDPDSASGKGSGRKALTAPVTMLWNPHVPPEIGEFLASLPSEATPKGTTKPINRLTTLATAIALDGLMSNPNQQAANVLFSVLDGQLAQRKVAVAQGVEEIHTADIRRITSTLASRSINDTVRQERADDRTVDEVFRSASRSLDGAVAKAYAGRLATAEDGGYEDFDIHAAKARVAALLSIPGVVEAVNAAADEKVADWLNQLRTTIKGLSEERRQLYDDIKRQARDPQLIDIVTPKSRIENTEDADGKLLPTRERHLLADENGNFPVGALNDWELTVLDTELDRPDIVAWYRNPSASTANALQVPYRIGQQWKPMQPDFIFFSTNRDGSLAASIVDPHSDHLSDALPKLKGLAEFAEKHGQHFSRIEAVSKAENELRMLDLTNRDVRATIAKETANALNLYRSNVAEKYV